MARTLPEQVRVAVIGAGFSGLGMAHGLLTAGIDDFAILEKADGVGGAWYHNRYPGCACDVPSRLYSFSWALKPDWTRSFSRQPEILAYLEEVTDRFGIGDHLHLGCQVIGQRWDSDTALWHLETTSGPLRAQVVVAGSGPLHQPAIPDIPGMAQFPGRIVHSAQWDSDWSLDGMRVAVVGTGASAVQIVPAIAEKVAHLTLFQRTPSWVTGRGDRPFSGLEKWLYKKVPLLNRAARFGIFAMREAMAPGFTRYPQLLRGLERAARRNLEQAITDPELRGALTPTFRIGCKRILLSNDYYPALARSTTTVVPAALASVEGSVVVGADGSRHEVDAIVFATGFHVTDPPIAAHVPTSSGVSLEERWGNEGMRALAGTAFAGVPNFFLMAGPNTGSGNTSLLLVIEAQVASIVAALRYMDAEGIAALEATEAAMTAYNDEVQRRMAPTVWNTGGCVSWYLDRQGRNTTLWPGSITAFRKAARFRPDDYHRRRRAPNPATKGVSR